MSTEGINGVLSGRKQDLTKYERALRDELMLHCNAGGDQIDCGGKHTNSSRTVIDDPKQKADSDAMKVGSTDNGCCAKAQQCDKEGGTNDNYDQLHLDFKYCRLRNDLKHIPIHKQMFDSLVIKGTREVVSMDILEPLTLSQNSSPERQVVRNGRTYRGKYRRKRHKKKESRNEVFFAACLPAESRMCDVDAMRYGQCSGAYCGSKTDLKPAPHLAPEEWQKSLLKFSKKSKEASDQSFAPSFEDVDNNGASSSLERHDTLVDGYGGGAILLDARNVYESKVGYFEVPGVPTLLSNTRKYASLPDSLRASIPHLAGKTVYMYCTGGVRCERASQYLQCLAASDAWGDLDKPKCIYQLSGGIQRYLERYSTSNRKYVDETNDRKCCVKGKAGIDCSSQDEDNDLNSKEDAPCLYRGKNFVFDPRRTDPLCGPSPPGRCVICRASHDDYDNGHAPADGMEARCCRCRVLVLVCNECRRRVRCWGEKEEDKSGRLENEGRFRSLFCGPHGLECVDEGNFVIIKVTES